MRERVGFGGSVSKYVELYENAPRSGYAALSDDELRSKTIEILKRLSEDRRMFGSSVVFWNGRVGEDGILYSNFGRSEDWKYGTHHDPRIWKSLVDRALISIESGGCEITQEGKNLLAAELAGSPTPK